MPDTGGELNELNGKMGISARENSVPIISLISKHNLENPPEVVDEIRKHVDGADCCDIVSQGTIEDFGENLCEAQEEYWGEKRYSLEECIEWEYDLFTWQSLKGTTMEGNAISILEERFSDTESIEFNETNEIIDNEYRIDIEVKNQTTLVSGIQVKPNSYKSIRREIKYQNKEANKKYNGEVFYLFYDYDSGEFENLDTVERELRDIIN